MIGAMVDQRVLEELARQYFPMLYDHFEQLQFKVALVALPWFLTLFINYTPLEVHIAPKLSALTNTRSDNIEDIGCPFLREL